MDRIKKGLSIFAFFFKIGCFTFGGGWAILAQMEQEFVNKRQIITKSELLEMVAVGKSAPGIMITNISLLFGYHVAGVFGGLCAVFGIITPAVIILSIVTLFYNSFKDNYWVHAGLTGLRAAVVPIIGSAALSLGKDALRTPPAIAICRVPVSFAARTAFSTSESTTAFRKLAARSAFGSSSPFISMVWQALRKAVFMPAKL